MNDDLAAARSANADAELRDDPSRIPSSDGKAGARKQPSAEAILASISDAVIVLDNDWRLIYSNPAADRVWGRDLDSLLGRTLHESLQLAPDNPFMTAYMKSKQSGERRYVALGGLGAGVSARLSAPTTIHPVKRRSRRGDDLRMAETARERGRQFHNHASSILNHLILVVVARLFSARQSELASDPRVPADEMIGRSAMESSTPATSNHEQQQRLLDAAGSRAVECRYITETVIRAVAYRLCRSRRAVFLHGRDRPTG